MPVPFYHGASDCEGGVLLVFRSYVYEVRKGELLQKEEWRKGERKREKGRGMRRKGQMEDTNLGKEMNKRKCGRKGDIKEKNILVRI